MAKTVTFTVGGEDVEVPALTWDIIEDTVGPILEDARLRAESARLAKENGVTFVGIPWYEMRRKDIEILAAAIRLPVDEVRRKLSLEESLEVSRKIGELLQISGFNVPGEEEAASPMETSGSTETTTDSSPDSSPLDLPT